MKKWLAFLLAFLLIAAPAALTEAVEQADSAAGDWFTSVEGVPVTLSLAPDGG